MFAETPGLSLRNTVMFIVEGGFRSIISITVCDSQCTLNSVATTVSGGCHLLIPSFCSTLAHGFS